MNVPRLCKLIFYLRLFLMCDSRYIRTNKAASKWTFLNKADKFIYSYYILNITYYIFTYLFLLYLKIWSH